MSDYIEQIKQAIVKRKKNDLEPGVRAALDDGLDVEAVINDALISAMDIVGQQFSNSEIFSGEGLTSPVSICFRIWRTLVLIGVGTPISLPRSTQQPVI